jgi:NHLM bacteriocin system ABC transporter peptidase/ATP-binding protein
MLAAFAESLAAFIPLRRSASASGRAAAPGDGNAARRGTRVRTPTVLQMENVECGAAALSIVLQYHGKILPLEQVRDACGISRNGTKASAIVRAAQRFGLNARALQKEPADLMRLPLPSIVFWNFNHYLVVEGFHGDKVYLNDPAVGRRVVSAQEFDQCFTGIALIFEKSDAFVKSGRRESPLRALVARLAGSEALFVLLMLATLALVVPGIVVPILYKMFIDEVLVGGMASWLQPLVMALLLAAAVKAASTFVQQTALVRLHTQLALRSSTRFLWHVFRLPAGFFMHRSGNEISGRSELNEMVATLLTGQLATNTVNVLVVGAYALLMLQYDAVLTAVAIATAAINILVLQGVSRLRKDANRMLQQEQAKLMATAMGGLQMIENLKATGSESDFFTRWAGHQARVVNAQQHLGVSSQVLAAVPPFLAALNVALVLGIGGVRVIDGLLTMGMLIAVQTLMSTFNEPVNRLVELGGKLQEAEAYVARLDDVLRSPVDPEYVRADGAPAGQTWRLEGQIELRNVTFGYSRLDPPLITDFSFVVKPGQRVALVGTSGSGKSTIAKIVCGLYAPWSGEILIDGQPRDAIPREVLCNSVAMVDQDIFLFNGTLRDNVTMWDNTIPEAMVIQATQDAQIHGAISERPDGYQGIVDEGGRNFSGGQRQRLEIARALATNPRILVLDEATSALDPRVESLVDDCLRRRGCTTLIIAHRLSTIRDADEIIVLEQGIAVERGTHAELLRREGAYSRLIQAY